MTAVSRRNLVLLALLALLLLLQFSLAAQRSFWEDEAATARLSALSSAEIITRRAQDNHPPLYWLLVSLWGRIFGFNELGLRSFSILCLAGVLVLVYELAGVFYSPRAAMLAGVLMATSPYILTYGHNARYYALAALLSLLALLGAYRYLEDRTLGGLVLYAVAGAILIYTIYMGGTVLLGINLWWLTMIIRRKDSLRRMVAWLVVQGLILLSYLPWIGFVAGVVERNLDPAFRLTDLPSAFALRLGYLGFAFSVGEFFSPLNPLVWIGIVICALGLLSALRHQNPSTGLLVNGLATAGLASILVSSVAVFPQSAWQNLSNRTLFIYPFFVILLSAGLDRLPPRWRHISLGLLLAVYLVGVGNVFAGRQAVKPLLIVPWVQVMEKIESESQPGAVVFCSQFDTVCPYYVDRYGLRRVALAEWVQALESDPPEVWWLQNNIGGYAYDRTREEAAFQALLTAYPQVEQFDYAPQDASIRQIKSRWLGQEDYPFRLNLFHFQTSVP